VLILSKKGNKHNTLNMIDQSIFSIDPKKIKLIEEIFPHITERKAPLSISNISTRSYYHWKTMSLVENRRIVDEKRNWIKINIYEYVWLEIINSCRNFGIPISDLLKVRSELVTIPALEFVDDIEGFRSLCYEMNDKGIQKFSSKEIDEKVESILLTQQVFSEIKEEDLIHLTILGSYINNSLLNQNKLWFCLFKDQTTSQAIIVTEEEFRVLDKIAPEWTNMPFLSINLTNLIENFIGEPRNEKNLSRWGFIDEDEKKVLQAIRNKKFSQIVIKRLNNSEELKIEATMDDSILHEKAKQIRKILGLDEYSEVHVKFRNDKHLFVKRTKKL
jgi:hypothetical protein